MLSFQSLPAAPIDTKQPIGASFVALGAGDFRAAARYLLELPYGRTRDRSDYLGVLSEGRGTCSTKHALLAALANENQLAVALTLGIYPMHEGNTPGVGQVLNEAALPYIPEAHCYLVYQSQRIDITRSGSEASEPIDRFLHEEVIAPPQIGDYKVEVHQRWIRQWMQTAEGGAGERNFEDVWLARWRLRAVSRGVAKG